MELQHRGQLQSTLALLDTLDSSLAFIQHWAYLEQLLLCAERQRELHQIHDYRLNVMSTSSNINVTLGDTDI